MIFNLFTYDFMVRAIITGTLVSLCSALLGVTLVLKRYSMIGDGLSHVSFGAYAIAFALGISPLKLSVPLVIAAAFFLLRISKAGKIKGDAAIALISTGALAAGIIATSLSKGVNVDIMSYMFGSILTISKSDVITGSIVSVAVLFIFISCFNKIFSVTFDESFSQASGIKPSIWNNLLAVLTAVTIVIGTKLMGTLLISGLIIFPALTSMRVFDTFKSVTISSGILSVISFFIGMCASFYLSIPTGASIVFVDIIVFIIFCVVGRVKNKIGAH